MQMQTDAADVVNDLCGLIEARDEWVIAPRWKRGGIE